MIAYPVIVSIVNASFSARDATTGVSESAEDTWRTIGVFVYRQNSHTYRAIVCDSLAFVSAVVFFIYTVFAVRSHNRPEVDTEAERLEQLGLGLGIPDDHRSPPPLLMTSSASMLDSSDSEDEKDGLPARDLLASPVALAILEERDAALELGGGGAKPATQPETTPSPSQPSPGTPPHEDSPTHQESRELSMQPQQPQGQAHAQPAPSSLVSDSSPATQPDAPSHRPQRSAIFPHLDTSALASDFPESNMPTYTPPAPPASSASATSTSSASSSSSSNPSTSSSSSSSSLSHERASKEAREMADAVAAAVAATVQGADSAHHPNPDIEGNNLSDTRLDMADMIATAPARDGEQAGPEGDAGEGEGEGDAVEKPPGKPVSTFRTVVVYTLLACAGLAYPSAPNSVYVVVFLLSLGIWAAFPSLGFHLHWLMRPGPAHVGMVFIALHLVFLKISQFSFCMDALSDDAQHILGVWPLIGSREGDAWYYEVSREREKRVKREKRGWRERTRREKRQKGGRGDRKKCGVVMTEFVE